MIVRNNIASITKIIDAKQNERNREVAYFIKERAQEYAPVDTGALQQSARVVKRVRSLTEDIIFVKVSPGYSVSFGAGRVFYAKFQEFDPYNRRFLTRAVDDATKRFGYTSSGVGVKQSKYQNFQDSNEFLDDIFS